MIKVMFCIRSLLLDKIFIRELLKKNELIEIHIILASDKFTTIKILKFSAFSFSENNKVR